MPEYLEVKEVISVSKTGQSSPYLCLCEDNAKYYIKFLNYVAGPELYAELICAELAMAYGLRIPPYALIRISDDVIEACRACSFFGSEHMIPGWAFGSQYQRLYYPYNNSKSISDYEKRRVLLFDWWIQNIDRQKDTPTIKNPNLLINGHEYFIIDHNNALTIPFCDDDFFENHLFHMVKQQCSKEFLEEEKIKLIEIANNTIQNITSLIPEGWGFGKDQTGVVSSVDKLYKVLSRVERGLWV